MLEIYLDRILDVCSNLATNYIPWKVVEGKAIALPSKDKLKAIEWENKKLSEKYDLIFVPDALAEIDFEKLKNSLLPHGKIYIILKDLSKRDVFLKYMWDKKIGLKDERLFENFIHFVFGIDQKFKKPIWSGEKQATVLVHCGGGFGDEFHTIRYLKKLKKDCLKVIYQSRPETYKLFKKCSDYDNVIITGQEVEYDFHISETKLYEKYGIHDFDPPYFSVESIKFDDKKHKNIGFIFKGNFIKYTKKRIFDISNFDIFKNKNLKIYCLQHEANFEKNKDKISNKFIDLRNNIKDWHDTARYIASMDYVLSPDTGFAHLSALIGKPTKVFLLPEHANVYMPFMKKYSPNYPGKMQLYWGHSAIKQIYEEIIGYKTFL
jgi:hypothetical protein